MKTFRQLYDWLFAVPKPRAKWWQVVSWWEARRPAYNAILFVAGILTIIGATIFLLLPPHPTTPAEANSSPDDFGEPFLAFMALALLVIGANLCYTLGWIVEVPIFLNRGDQPTVAPILLKAGLIFSFVLFSLPTIISLIYWIYRIFN